MSASSKKKLRKEQNAATLTEKQRKEQAEAKKLKAYSITFIAIMLVVAITALSVMGVTAINRTGILQKNTITATIDGHEINTVELSYYYNDIINLTWAEWYDEYAESTNLMLALNGLDVASPLDKQEHPDGGTWADYFVDAALERLKSDYALCKAAKAAGFELSEEQKKEVENDISDISFYAALNGYQNVDDYLEATYCFGASEESYRQYSENSHIATEYYNQYSNSLKYDDAAIREYEKDKYDNYSSFTFARYFVSRSSYLTGGTKNESGSITYSDAEHEAARAAAEKAANALLTCKTVEELDKAIAAMDINANSTTPVASTKLDSKLYTSVDELLREWLADDDRKENDITAIPYEVTSTGTDGKETTSINGYFVVMFQNRNDNIRPLANVRHLLVEFEVDDDAKKVTDEGKAAAKKEAEAHLKTWKEGAATEESFIELVKKHSDDASASVGGLFENITLEKGIYVDPFYNWCVDETRKKGDTEVIETEYGYHVMYYVGDGEQTYRDTLIVNDMKSEALEKWASEIIDAVTITKGNISRLETGVVLNPV